jgi:hypothetical protein
MDYGFGKTYTLPNKFTALNGCAQYYTVDFTNVIIDKTQPSLDTDAKKAEAEANLLRVLEVLRTYGGQPIITTVDNKTLKFTLEQANVYGDASKKQPSAKNLLEDATAQIEALFANLKAVNGSTSLACTATVEAVF